MFQLLWLISYSLAISSAFAYVIFLVRNIFITSKLIGSLRNHTLIARSVQTAICLEQFRDVIIPSGHGGSDSSFVLGYHRSNIMRFVYICLIRVALLASAFSHTDLCLVQFKLFYNPENEVVIEENWKDNFPHDHRAGEWIYSPSSRDTTPYLHDSVLSHYVRNPNHAPPGDFLWKRIPKKFRDQLSCHNDPERTGWGLVMNEEWHQTSFLVFWVPILAIGAVGLGLYCYYTKRTAAVGFSMFAGLLALIVWFYQLAQGYAKQGGLL